MAPDPGIDRPVTRRLLELDWLRGLAVAGMILVTSPGDWTRRYSQLDHAAWEGWTLADMVFPTFLFGVGFALALSFPRASLDGAWGRVLRRTLLLILLGLFLNALPWLDLANLRIPGILQRIALCYAAAAALLLLTARRDAEGRFAINIPAIAIAAIALLIGYWLLLALVPVPGFGAGRFDSHGSWPAYVDRLLLPVRHLWFLGTTEGVGVTYDPEGLVSTLGAIANVLAGVLAAALLLRLPPPPRIAWMLGLGLAGIAIGYALWPLLPVNKRIWTSSFAILSSGFSIALLGLLTAAARIEAARILGSPFRVLGANAILAFILSQLLSAISGIPMLPDGMTPQAWGFSVASAVVPDPYLASLACALGILALVVLAVLPLHRRGIHLRL